MADRKKTDERDAERAMKPVLAELHEKWHRQEIAALEEDLYLSDPMSTAYSLPLMVNGLPGVTVQLLEREDDEESRG